MKLKFLTTALILFSTIANANIAYTDLRNGTPFGEKQGDGPKIEYNKFGEKRTVNVKSASYNHYNQAANQQHRAIIGSQEQYNASRQSVALNSNQYNYGAQNSTRKGEVATSGQVHYNTPMQVDRFSGKGTLSQTVASNNIVIETGMVQRMDIDDEGNADTPNDSPLGSGIVVFLLAAGAYILKLRVES